MLPILGPILISILSASLTFLANIQNYQYSNIITNTDINIVATICDDSLQAQTHLHTDTATLPGPTCVGYVG